MQLTSGNFFSYYTIMLLNTNREKVLFPLLPHNIVPQRIRQLHRLTIAKGTAFEFAGEIEDAAAPAVFIGEIVHHLCQT